MNRLLLIALLLVLAVFTTACSEDKSSAGLAKDEMVPASAYAPVSGNRIYSRPDLCDTMEDVKTKIPYVDQKLHKYWVDATRTRIRRGIGPIMENVKNLPH